MKTILCYGDSNTWGYDPHTEGRYDHKTRWTMVLAQILNNGFSWEDPPYWVVEEGQNGRTTCREDPVEGDKNGLRQIGPILESHKPLDVVVIMLGTNDLKIRFTPTPLDIAKGAQNVVTAVQHSCSGPNNGSPEIIMICPPPTVDAPVLLDILGEENNRKMAEQLPRFFRQCAKESGVRFLDAGELIQTSPVDGVHLDPPSHRRLAEAVAEIIQAM
jgi:lysophospholipase L1-like esterase